MASNPRFPNEREPGRGPVAVEGYKRPGGAWGKVILALLAAAALLAVIMWQMPTTPKVSPTPTSAEAPAQPVNSAVQIQDVQISTSPDGNSAIIQGTVTNASTQTIHGLDLAIDFMGNNGQVVATESSPITVLSIRGSGNDASAAGESTLADAPMKPNDQRPFRVRVNRVPQGWNHQMPGIRVANVASSQS